MTEAYHLQWPPGRSRTPDHKRMHALFKISRARAVEELLEEIRRLGGRLPVISSNLATYRKGGVDIPYAEQRIQDPGVAVYFELKGSQRCFALDQYRSIDDNIRAIGLTIAALRSIERYGGVAMMDAAFAGFKALPSPEMVMAMPARRSWHQVLGVSPEAPEEVRKAAYRALARKTHPDAGGSRQAWDELQQAAKEAGISETRARE